MSSLKTHYPPNSEIVMDQRFSKYDTGVAVRSLLSKPYEPNHIETEAPKLIEMMKQKLSQLGGQGKIFRRTFSIREGEKLLQASQCYLYTTAGPIAGLLFVSTERVAFCSDKSLKTYSNTGDLLKFRYKVSIPLGKIKGVRETKRPSNNYVELVTVDDFSFWFLGFVNYKKSLRYLHHAVGLQILSN